MNRDDGRKKITKIRGLALVIGIISLIVCAVAALWQPAEFFRAYLAGYLLWLGVALGSLGILMLQYLTGGVWGVMIRRTLEASAVTLPLLAILFLPVLFGMRLIYPWTDHAFMASDIELAHKVSYLNVTFFLIRAVIYFIVWIALAWELLRCSHEQDHALDKQDLIHWGSRMQRLSAPGLIILSLTIMFASVDWLMSLDPQWHSTIFGLLILCGQGLIAFAFIIIVAAALNEKGLLVGLANPERFNQLGNLLLTFVMLWTYCAFSQFLLIWSGDLPNEIPWYLRRLRGGSEWVGIALILFQFAVPFALLLSRAIKQDGRKLATVAIFVFLMRIIDLYWMVGPPYQQNGIKFHLFDIPIIVGIGGVWLSEFLRRLSQHSLLPQQDPVLIEAQAHGE